MLEHLQKYGKAYSGATAALGADAIFGQRITLILMWLLSLTGANPPAEVSAAIEGAIMFIFTAIAIALVRNVEGDRKQPGPRPQILPIPGSISPAAPADATRLYHMPPRYGYRPKPEEE